MMAEELVGDSSSQVVDAFSVELFNLFSEAHLCFEEPYPAYPAESIYGIRTKRGYIFDDTFWDLFLAYPFHICHVTSLAEGVLEMRFRVEER